MSTRLKSRTCLRSPSGSSENLWSVPFQERLRVKCFSTTIAPSIYDHRAEHIRHDRGEYAVIVRRIADYSAGKLLLQYFYYAEIQVVVLGGVFGYAMEKADFVVMFYDGFVRHADLFHCGGPGGDEHRLFEFGYIFEKRGARHVAGGYLVACHAQFLQKVRALEVKGR